MRIRDFVLAIAYTKSEYLVNNAQIHDTHTHARKKRAFFFVARRRCTPAPYIPVRYMNMTFGIISVAVDACFVCAFAVFAPCRL